MNYPVFYLQLHLQEFKKKKKMLLQAGTWEEKSNPLFLS